MILLPVNKIVDSSCVDGPGNRSVVFFQGCNFNCTYCHNPETINRCDSCGECISHCPTGALRMQYGEVRWNRAVCNGCDTCITLCPHKASPKVQVIGSDQIADLVETNLPFIRGVTFSGGECMLQAGALVELCERLSKSVGSVMLDSNGSIDFSLYPRLLAACDGVLLDMKCYDETKHFELTGQSNKQVIANAIYLAKMGKLAEIRTVVVPNELPNEDTVSRTAELVAQWLPKGMVIPYKLIRFRRFGVRGVATGYQSPSNGEMEALRAMVSAYPCFRPLVV
ncbi:MAG: YjjW family glycine radical enzyme activase [Sphaerochaetaceae bacterium]